MITCGIQDTIVFKDLKPAIEQEYKWLQNWIENENEMQKIVEEIFLKNIYIRRVDEEDIIVTDRMIYSTMKSRNILYRQAAELLFQYRKIMSHDIDTAEAKILLQNTFITPEKIDVLFELYWSFKLIEYLTFDKKPIYHLINGENNIVAEWEDENYLYCVFHNSCGSAPFSEKLANIKRDFTIDDFLSRTKKVIENWQVISKELFRIKPEDSLWDGIPDILIEKFNKKTNEINKVFIGEVKNTTSKSYAMQGLKQLLEYMVFKRDLVGKYFEDKDIIFSTKEKIIGCLFLDKINLDIKEKLKYPNVKIIEFGDDFKERKMDLI